MLNVDKIKFRHHQLDHRGLATPSKFDFLSFQQGSNHTQVMGKLFKSQGFMSHNAHRSVARADAEERPPRSQAVNRSNTMCRHRSDTRPSNGHPGAELYRASLLCRQRQHRITIRPNHLTIRNPRMRITQVLCMCNVTNLVHFSGHAHAKFHTPHPFER